MYIYIYLFTNIWRSSMPMYTYSLFLFIDIQISIHIFLYLPTHMHPISRDILDTTIYLHIYIVTIYRNPPENTQQAHIHTPSRHAQTTQMCISLCIIHT